MAQGSCFVCVYKNRQAKAQEKALTKAWNIHNILFFPKLDENRSNLWQEPAVASGLFVCLFRQLKQ